MKHISLTDQKYLLIQLLKKMGNQKPKNEHIQFIASLISNSVFGHQVLFTNRLTDRETRCLALAAKGMTSSETANLLGVKPSTIDTYRKRIKKKLSCSTMIHAVSEGLRFGYIHEV